MTRQAKVDVDYTPKAKNPSEQCQWCAHFYGYKFRAPIIYRCTLVGGLISPQGWCKLFRANSQ